MAHCERCNRFMLFSSKSGYCKECCDVILNEERERRGEEQQKKHEEGSNGDVRKMAEAGHRKIEQDRRMLLRQVDGLIEPDENTLEIDRKIISKGPLIAFDCISSIEQGGIPGAVTYVKTVLRQEGLSEDQIDAANYLYLMYPFMMITGESQRRVQELVAWWKGKRRTATTTSFEKNHAIEERTIESD